MMDQAAKLRDLVQSKFSKEEKLPSEKGPRIIAITSGKGGVGKTNLVVNLGLTLAKLGHKVIVLDADLGLANVEVLLGLIPKYSLYDVLQGKKQLSDIMVEGPYNLKLIPGGTGIQELANLNKYQREKILQGIKEFESEADFILVDTGAGINRNVLGFIAAASEVIVIATPEPTSLTDAYSLIKIMAKFKIHPEVGLLINRASDEKEAKQTFNKILMVASKYLEIKINDLGYIPDDLYVAKAVKDQAPFAISYPNSKAAFNINRIAQILVNHQQVPEKNINKFISRLMRLFS